MTIPRVNAAFHCTYSSEGREASDKIGGDVSGDDEYSDWGSDSDESSSESEAGGAVPLRSVRIP